MNEQPTSLAGQPDHPALRLDAACDRFEAAWRDGRRPRIEEALGDVPESERAGLFRALLELELDFRRGAGEAPSPEEYRRRFPRDPEVIAAAFAGTASAPRTVAMVAAADLNLLLGILALQNDFVSREALVETFNAWVADKSRPLAQVLRDRGHVDAAQAELLEALAREHLKRQGGDPRASLAALSSLGSARDTLRRIDDPEVQASLGRTAVYWSQHPRPVVGTNGPASGVSRFRILRPHARGGLGEVYVAYDGELHREVALKEIRPGRADDPESRTRFLREAEITGNLEHPGVVPVYGLGQYGDGRPYYAMRFVQGDSLKAAIEQFHVDDGPDRDPGERAVSLRGLLGRFLDVCDAIAYAHSRGVLHRDLKPGNIMMGKYGETLVVDWGLAKPVGHVDAAGSGAAEPALQPSSASGSMPTVAGVALGTPGFMSPEQAAGELDRLGPRSDVYSLGATLYCLLVGRAPLEASGVDTEQALRRVRAGEIVPPRRVKRAVPPALEAVSLKAMALRPEDRYPSARALADEIEHWLADEPVSAWREPWPARAWRWAKRHRTTVAGAVVALVASVVGLAAVAVVQARANDRLGAAQAETLSVLDYLVEAFRSPDPEQDGGQVKVADILKRAGARVDKEFDQKPAMRGKLLDTLGRTYVGLGLYADAATNFEKACRTREAALGPDHVDTLTSRFNLATAYQESGRTAEAIALHEATLRRRQGALGPDHPDTLRSRNNLANAYWSVGRLDEAIALHEATLRRREAVLGPDHGDTLASRSNLAAYRAAGRASEGIALFEATLRRRESELGPDHIDTLASRSNLAAAYHKDGQRSRAIELLEPTLEQQKAKLGADHPHTLASQNTLANIYRSVNRLDEAIRLHEATLKSREAGLGPDHSATLESRYNLGAAYYDDGRLKDAIRLFKETLEVAEAKLGRDHAIALDSRNNLAVAYWSVGRLDEAIALHKVTLRSQQDKLGPDHPDTLRTRNNLAVAYWSVGRLGEAIALQEVTLKLREVKLPPDHPDTLESRNNLGASYHEAGRELEAMALFQGTLERSEVKLGPDHAITLDSRSSLAIAHETMGWWVKAEGFYRDILVRRRKTEKPDSLVLAEDLTRLARNLIEQSRWSDAAPPAREAHTIRKEAAPEDWSRFDAMSVLGGALLGQGRYGESEPLVLEGYKGLKARAALIPVPSRFSLREAAERIVRLYEAWNRPDQAAAWKAELGLRDLPAVVFAQP
jgi:serine/threonine protein kinase